MAGNDDQVAEHQRMWHNFTRLMVICMAGTALILALMGIFLV